SPRGCLCHAHWQTRNRPAEPACLHWTLLSSRVSTRGSAMAKLFLSYAREDAATAGRLARVLERAGHDVWWDRELHAGASFGSEIERQPKDCNVVIVRWSAGPVHS